MSGETIYVIKTNLPPESVSLIAQIIFMKWIDFAMGHSMLNGRRLMYPTGRYASAIQYREEGEAAISIIANAGQAPEAAVLEHGHAQFDLKTRLQAGRAYPMHRFTVSNKPGGLRRSGSGPPGSTPRIWAEVRQRESNGFASFGPNSDPGSWIMPAMAAYSPAQALASMAQDMVRKMGG